jgi:hypothetical protein
MLKSPGGPVAVFAGSRVTMPYGMSVLGLELMRQCFAAQPETLGEAILAAKRRTMSTENLGRYRAALDSIATVVGPAPDLLEAERAEHLDLFNLLGDPLLRVAYPGKIAVTVEPVAKAGAKLAVSLTTPLAGRGVVELAVRRDRLTFSPPRREQFDASTLGGYDEIYRLANETRLVSRRVELAAGSSAIELEVPGEARGACHVRIFLAGPDGCAAGAGDVRIDNETADAAPPRSVDAASSPRAKTNRTQSRR